MDNFVITTGSGSYTGPVTLVAWIFIHPWMTLFICLSIAEAFEAWGKAFGRRKK